MLSSKIKLFHSRNIYSIFYNFELFKFKKKLQLKYPESKNTSTVPQQRLTSRAVRTCINAKRKL